VIAAPIHARGLGKRYRQKWALRDCNLDVPAGSITALVGPNGAGKSTLLHLLAGLVRPTTGRIELWGEPPSQTPAWLGQVGFLAQDVPLYRHLTGDQLLGMGAHLNPNWDEELARGRLQTLDIPLDRPTGQLSGGERAQIGLALALGKRPRLLLLDEPVASLDPLARKEFLSSLAEAGAETGVAVVLSSHLVADIERVCDHLVLLSSSKVQLSGEIESLLESHKLLTGPRHSSDAVAATHHVVTESHTERQTTLLVRLNGPLFNPSWETRDIGLEELVLGYMSRRRPAPPAPVPPVRLLPATGEAVR
jgi:ABC-2 type transport system ATP-binding protein